MALFFELASVGVQVVGVALVQVLPVSSVVEPNADSRNPSISGDGLLVAFSTAATNLFDDPNASTEDIALYRVVDRSITCLSPPSVEGQPGDCRNPAISADGRYVAFDSVAANLTPLASSGVRNIYVRDVAGSRTRCISTPSDAEAANGPSMSPAISTNGDYVAFESEASNLVQGDTNGVADVFVWIRKRDSITRVSVRSDGGQADKACGSGDISGDGQLVTFVSTSGTLGVPKVPREDGIYFWGEEHVFVHRLQDATTRYVSDGAVVLGAKGDFTHPALSEDGTSIAFEFWDGEKMGGLSVGFATDLQKSDTQQIQFGGASLARVGILICDISSSGRYVAFGSSAESSLFLYDRQEQKAERLSRFLEPTEYGPDGFGARLSANAEVIAYTTTARPHRIVVLNRATRRCRII
jgi:Tol biopolymer transport system component